MTITWGDPIPVIDGRLPDNPDYIDEQWRFCLDDPANVDLEVILHRQEGGNCLMIRLPADHPLYAKPERQEQPADPLRERMEALVRNIVPGHWYDRMALDIDGWQTEASAIVAELDAAKVDPDVLLVRDELAKAYEAHGSEFYADEARKGNFDSSSRFIAALSCLRLGREQGK